ncbi:hypothetical protein BKA63DRAFT_527398 [Paraphoma chrysanthemicola]|nr:hypothetical protein BKA63DRAFT_527398 [Paraphoma chrysanthemicola]
MEWTQVSPRHWARQMDGVEKYFHAISSLKTPCGIAHSMVSVGAKLPTEAEYKNDRYEAAWKALRYEHPRIACSVSNDTIHYSIPDEKELQAWLARTLIVHDSARSGLDVLSTMRSSSEGILVLLPKEREVFFQISHQHIDGVGAMMFLDRLFDALQHPVDVTFGDEHRNLSNSLSYNLQAESPGSDHVCRAQTMAKTFATTLPELTLNRQPSRDSSHLVRMQKLSFSARKTQNILSKTKHHGISITHATHAAVIQALRCLAQGNNQPYATLLFFNLRSKLPPRPKIAHSPVSVHMMALPAVIHAFDQLNFKHLAQRLKDDYNELFADSANIRAHQPLYDCFASNSVSRDYGKVFLSSLGIVSDRVHHNLEDFWIGAGSATADLTVFLWTFKGQLTIAIWFNEGYHRASTVQEFLVEIRSALSRGLNADMAQD